jgi:hypothetical protein
MEKAEIQKKNWKFFPVISRASFRRRHKHFHEGNFALFWNTLYKRCQVVMLIWGFSTIIPSKLKK